MAAIKLLSLVALCSSALLPNVPEPSDPAAIVFVLAWSALFYTWLMQVALKGAVARTRTAAWAAAFLVLVLFSGLVATFWGTPFDLWFRGALPFLFLATVFPWLDLARRHPGFLLNSLHIASVVWLGKVLVVTGMAIPAVLFGEFQRLTHATEDWGSLALPFGMVGLALTLFNPDPRALRWRWLLAVPFTVMSFLTVYRSQIAIVTLIWLYFVWTRPQHIRWRVATFFTVAAAGFAALLAATPLGDALVARFSEGAAEIESSRALEISYALAQFVESPLVGKGLGHQVPAQVTFAGDWEVILTAGVDSVGYIHNLAAYLLMDLGIAGLLTYAGFVLLPLVRAPRAANAGVSVLSRPARVALAAVLLFCLVQATYRLIQTNLIVAACVAVLAQANRKVRSPSMPRRAIAGRG